MYLLLVEVGGVWLVWGFGCVFSVANPADCYVFISYPRGIPSAQAPELNLDDNDEVLVYDKNRFPRDVNNDDKVQLHHELSDNDDGNVLVEVTTGSLTMLTTTRSGMREVTAGHARVEESKEMLAGLAAMIERWTDGMMSGRH